MFTRYSQCRASSSTGVIPAGVVNYASEAGSGFIHSIARRVSSRLFYVAMRALRFGPAPYSDGLRLLTAVLMYLLTEGSGVQPLCVVVCGFCVCCASRVAAAMRALCRFYAFTACCCVVLVGQCMPLLAR